MLPVMNQRPRTVGLLIATPSFRTRATLGDRSFYVAASKLWITLPRDIRALTDIRILNPI